MVDVAIDAGDDFLTIDFDNVRFSRFASGFFNGYVFTFDSAQAPNFVGATVDTSVTTLGLTDLDLSFSGNQLFVNVESLSFNTTTFAKINLISTGGPDLISPQRQLPTNQWALISLPSVPPANQNTVQHIFSDDIDAPYGEWNVYGFDAAGGSYFNVGLEGIMRHGYAYWIMHTSDSTITLDMPSGSLLHEVQITSACPSTEGCFRRVLDTTETGEQWNAIGNPHPFDPALENMRVTTDTGVCSEPEGCNLAQAKAANVQSDQFWEYDGLQYLSIDTGDRFAPWQGYWNQALPGAYSNSATFLIPAR